MSPAGQDLAAPARRGPRLSFPGITAVALLAAATIFWSAVPLAGGGSGTRLSLIVAIVSGVLSIGQLAVTATLVRDPDGFSLADQVTRRLADLLRAVPWAELMTLATLALEALHSSPPWHTAVLTVALLGYLIALHLAESGAGASVLRTQVPLLAAGVGLTALAVGAAALPGPPAGPADALIRIAAVVVAVVVAGLAVPAWLGRSR